MGTDTRSSREIYREIILENIEYRHLVQNNQIDRERLDELVELIVDTVCSARKTIRIARRRLSGGGGKIPLYETGQFPYRICAFQYAGEYHLCPQHQEISAGSPV